MRAIKFRAWSKQDKRYIHEKELFDPYHCPVIPHRDHFSLDQKEVIAEQFTGMLDKNGKKIYEGDIIECSDWEENANAYNRWKTVVKYEDKEGRFVGVDGMNNEVVGNIHENPELMKT